MWGGEGDSTWADMLKLENGPPTSREPLKNNGERFVWSAVQNDRLFGVI